MSNLRQQIKSIIDALPVSTSRQEHGRGSSNGLAVFVSVVAAILIWFMISMQEPYSVVRDFPVEFINMDPDTAFSENPTRLVRVRVEGAGWQLLKLYTTDTPIQIEVSTGAIDLFSATSRNLAPDLVPRSVVPDWVVLPLEPRTTRTLPIKLSSQIETVPPFDLIQPVSLEPDSVEVSGAGSVLARLESWPSLPLMMENVNLSFVTRVALSDTMSGLVTRSIDEVTAVGQVTEFTENSRLLNVAVTGAPGGDDRFRLIPDQVSVTYRVPIAQFEASAIADSFYATVSYADILSDTTGRVSPRIRLPADIVVKDLNVETPRLRYYVVIE